MVDKVVTITLTYEGHCFKYLESHFSSLQRSPDDNDNPTNLKKTLLGHHKRIHRFKLMGLSLSYFMKFRHPHYFLRFTPSSYPTTPA
ncbi:hypothetical protein TNCT_549211 [Trichonephila clavata]|uniref:Uncharacterized protein n=1 Tax=Trichonephila clavata TaxID=2740835 RepID=A0A8X6LB28_TRICU|nr:hypothetical protein TNCT_549211 [Trichonephila clavata]